MLLATRELVYGAIDLSGVGNGELRSGWYATWVRGSCTCRRGVRIGDCLTSPAPTKGSYIGRFNARDGVMGLDC